MALPVNFKDDVLASSMDGKRRYNMITNSDGTVSFEDVTTYSQEGSNFGSAQINNTNGAINTINNNVLDTIEQISANTSSGKFAGALALKNVNNSFGGMKFGIDSDGNYGYIKAGADSVTPFRSDYFFLNSMKTSVYNATLDMGYITVTIPTDDCYILYGTTFGVDNGVAMRTNSQTSFSISSGVTPLFEAIAGNNNLIGLVHCRGLKGKSLTINTNLSVYRMSARIYY